MIGIYKITSPSKRVYVGQSVNIKDRIKKYKKGNCAGQVKLYRSILKYGFEKHEFEILCECEVYELNDKERYYQDLYSVLGIKGMNCRLTGTNDRSGIMSNDSRLKISKSSMGKLLKEETKIKIGLSHKNRKHSDQSKKNMSDAHKGNVNSLQTRIKISIANKGRIVSKETKEKLSKYVGRPVSIETRNKIRKSLTGKKASEESKLKKSNMVLDCQMGIFYNSIKEVSLWFNIPYSTIKKKLNGTTKNNTSFLII
jgi:group I intron endonuclease